MHTPQKRCVLAATVGATAAEKLDVTSGGVVTDPFFFLVCPFPRLPLLLR